MSNIEPTEEQKQAVMAIAETEGARVQKWRLEDLARLLAEREAKLREEVKERYDDFMGALKGWKDAESENDELRAEAKTLRAVDERKSRMLYDRDVVIDTLRARVAELEASVTTFHEAWKGAERDFNEQTKRIAELEAFQSEWQQKDGNTPGYNLQKAKNYGTQAYEWKQKAIKLEAREAQHLADIKALAQRVRDLHQRCLRLAGGHSFDGACVECVNVNDVPEHLRDFRCWKHTPLPFTNDDDAKADAPAGTEGGEG